MVAEGFSGEDASLSLHCMACGALLAHHARFCTGCGTAAGTVAAPNSVAMGDPASANPHCAHCGGDGRRLPADADFCPSCRWLRPLAPGYAVPVQTFLWQLDATAMRTLNGIGPLAAIARTVSERVGRPWLEASVNGVRLSDRQLPDVFALAKRAARIIGLGRLPEVYVSGEQPWDALTLGSDQSAFVVIGSALLSFKPDELLFLLGREMGHCKAGHALWKTVYELAAGRTSGRRAIAGGGLLQFINPTRLIEAAIDSPFMAWARHADITADRAGMLVSGQEEVVRKVLLQLALRSFPIYERLNMDAWKEQEAASAAGSVQLSEWTLASTPFVAGRLRNLVEFARQDDVRRWRAIIEANSRPPETIAPGLSPEARPASPGRGPDAPTPSGSPPPQAQPPRLAFRCTGCAAAIAVPRPPPVTRALKVKCPGCAKVMELTMKPAAEPLPRPDPAAAAALRIDRSAVAP